MYLLISAPVILVQVMQALRYWATIVETLKVRIALSINLGSRVGMRLGGVRGVADRRWHGFVADLLETWTNP